MDEDINNYESYVSETNIFATGFVITDKKDLADLVNMIKKELERFKQ